MNIVYTANASFVPQTAASIASVCVNCREEQEICFHVFSQGIPPLVLAQLTDMVRAYEREGAVRSLRAVELDDIRNYFDFSFDTSGWDPIVLARLVIAQLLPDEIHRVLYLDGDTIVRKSLRDLWDTDMGSRAIAAAPEPTCGQERKAALGLGNGPYYNAGVLLIDLDNWRRNGTGEEIVRYYRERGGQLLANDQDAINGSQRGKIVRLPETYNYHNTYDIYRYQLLLKVCEPPVMTKTEFEEMKRDPCIVHFLGEDRPWREGCTHRFRGEYLYYLSLTPWKDQPPETGWKTYFFCWSIFNGVMRPFPVLRMRIVNSLIPLMLRRR